jgi:hypothetical protein
MFLIAFSEKNELDATRMENTTDGSGFSAVPNKFRKW